LESWAVLSALDVLETSPPSSATAILFPRTRINMPRLENGRIESDPWQKLADDAALRSAPCFLSLSRLQQDEAVRTAPHLRLGSPCRLTNRQRFWRPISTD
jgi:hypothetical protein